MSKHSQKNLKKGKRRAPRSGSQKESSSAFAKTIDEQNLLEVISSINPKWADLENCFAWPADVFLMTSYILKKSGAYRNVSEIRKWKISKPAEHANAWLSAIQKSLLNGKKVMLPPFIQSLACELQQAATIVKFTQLKASTADNDDTNNLVTLIMKSHIIADEACVGLGLLGGHHDPNVALVQYLANLLLVARGTMSSAPKNQGIVIPKMRTPQSGLTLRSYSQHLSYHDTEVEIMWRSVPWVNKDQNTLNILCVPWPREIKTSDFSCTDETFDHARFFEYEKKEDQTASISRLVSMIKNVNHEYTLHLVVFPEMALSIKEYTHLLRLLKQEFENGKLKSIPMIISGVNEAIEKKPNRNTVKLAIYFSGKWYDMSQSKHHRWKLNRSQLMQYELSSRMSTERNWFESIQVEQRRLSFFVPNGWLALCPLICEDLAQLEPVSEVIRGVGPTLLFALLMDGPQLKDRWPARYASIFADDPGTAVLTLTSLGMMQRSKKIDDYIAATPNQSEKSFALWKDQTKGWRNLNGADNIKKTTAVISISASLIEEFTADGRSDSGAAATFKLDNIYYPEDVDTECHLDIEESENRKDSIWFGDWLDLRELTTSTFAIDALISLQGHHWDLINFWNIPLEGKKEDYTLKAPYYYHYLIQLLANSYKNPNFTGIKTESNGVKTSGTSDYDKRRSTWPTPSMEWAMEQLKQLNHVFRFDEKKMRARQKGKEPLTILDYWESLYLECKALLERKDAEWLTAYSTPDQDKVRIERAMFLAVLSSLHNRLDQFRMKYYNLEFQKIPELFKKIAETIEYHNKLHPQPKHEVKASS